MVTIEFELPAGGQSCVNLGVTLSDLPHFPCSSRLHSAAVNGALNKAHYPVAQPPKTEVPLGLPLGARRGCPLWVFSQEFEEGGGGIHYGYGGCNVQMARCYAGTCPTLQQSQLSSPAHLGPPAAPVWWSHRAGQAERRRRRTWRCFTDKI